MRLFVFLLWFVPMNLVAQTWSDQINSECEFFSWGGIGSVPAMGCLYTTHPDFLDQVLVLDHFGKRILKLGRKGVGPEEYRLAARLLSNGSELILHDSQGHKLQFHDITGEHPQLTRVLPYSDPAVLNVVGYDAGHWYITRRVFRDTKHGPSIDLKVEKTNDDLEDNETLLTISGRPDRPADSARVLFVSTSNGNELVVLDPLQIQGDDGIIPIQIMDLDGGEEKTKLLRIPRTFLIMTEPERERTMERFKNRLIPEFVAYLNQKKYHDFNGVINIGLDGRLQVSFLRWKSKSSFDVLINLIDLDSNRVEQVVYDNKGLIPVVFAPASVYAQDTTDDDYPVLVLPRSSVLKGSNSLTLQ